LREISSVFVAWFVIETLLQISALIDGPEAWIEMQDFFANPFVIALNVISLFFVVFHAITWFNLTPKAMVLRLRGKRVPDWVIVGLNYAACLALSGVVAFMLARG